MVENIFIVLKKKFTNKLINKECFKVAEKCEVDIKIKRKH